MYSICLLLPEQQHESLEESAKVVVVIDSRVLIQLDVAKHLRQRHSEENEFVQFTLNMNIITHLHPNDGINEEEHSNQQADIRQGLKETTGDQKNI